MFKCFCVKRSAVKEDDAFTNLKFSCQEAAPPSTVRSCFARARVGQQNAWLLLGCFRNTVFAIPQVQPAVAIAETRPAAVESAAKAVVPSEMMTLEIVDRVTSESDTDRDHLPNSDSRNCFTILFSILNRCRLGIQPAQKRSVSHAVWQIISLA